MQIINYPLTGYQKEDYFHLYEKVVDSLKTNPAIKCICTFGGVNQPGISDIDLLITFKNDCRFSGDIISDLTERERLLFTHGVMALSEQHWFQNKSYAMWDNQKLIFGEQPDGNNILVSNEELSALKKQTALEFLFTNYIDLTLQKEYGVIKLRDLLQHTKGLTYDLNYLNLLNTSIDNYISNAKEWIANWHQKQPSNREIEKWFIDFHQAYSKFIQSVFEADKIYLPGSVNRNFSKNIILKSSKTISYTRSGLLLPSFIAPLGQKRYLKLMNKLNNFEFSLPYTANADNSILEKRIQFFKEMKMYNQLHFPKLGLLTTSLMSKLV
ncbi:MAG: hypothetical protein ACK5B3_08625 [Bacteroidota bacterium]|jgi:hypothetical protein